MLTVLFLALPGCNNNPYPLVEARETILYHTIALDPKTLDPAVCYVDTDSIILDAICESYFNYHYLRRPVELKLSLGAEMPQRSAYVYREAKGRPRTGERWSFRIKRGVKFQDDPCFPGGKGRELVAADFLRAFRRIADAKLREPCPILPFVLDKIVGLKEYNDLSRKQRVSYEERVAGLQSDPVDPYRFHVLLSEPYPQLRYLMAMHFTGPVAQEAISYYKNDFREHPVGTGPYVLEQWSKRRRIVLRRNPNFRNESYPSDGEPGDPGEGYLRDAGKPLPLSERVVFSFIREGVTGWNLFMQGYLDVWGVSAQNRRLVITPQGQLTETMQRHGIRLRTDSDPAIYYVAFNMEDPVVGGYTPRARKLRQALSLAVDSQAFIDQIAGGNGDLAQFVVPPGLLGYEPDYRNPYRQYDLERAKRLLTEAGYPGGNNPRTGERLALTYDNYADTAGLRQMVGFVQKAAESIGIRLESKSRPFNVWQTDIDRGRFQVVDYGWLADYPDPENFCFLLYGPNKRPGPNLTAYHRPEYDRLFVRMRAMEDGPERLALIRQMRAMAVEDCPLIYLYHDVNMLITHQWYRNRKPHPTANDVMQYRTVDPEQRARLRAQWNRPNYWPLAVMAIVLAVATIPALRTIHQRRHATARRRGSR